MKQLVKAETVSSKVEAVDVHEPCMHEDELQKPSVEKGKRTGNCCMTDTEG